MNVLWLRFVFRDALLISLVNCCTSIVAGFAIFSIVGYMAEQQGKTVPEVASQGMDEGSLNGELEQTLTRVVLNTANPEID